MKSIKLFVVAIALTICAPAAAEEFAPITGAWGVKLGQVWTDKSGSAGYSVGDESYDFVPAKPTPGLDTYSVTLHPDTNRVYEIRGGTLYLSTAMSSSYDYGYTSEERMEDARTKVRSATKAILSHLEKKYGKAQIAETQPLFDFERPGWEASIVNSFAEDHEIYLYCGELACSLTYIDNNVRRQRNKVLDDEIKRKHNALKEKKKQAIEESDL